MSEWFSDWFNEDYALVYPHRNEIEADKIIKLFEFWAKPIHGLNVLDACCGLGRLSFLLAKKGAKVKAFDLSHYFIQENKQQNVLQNLEFIELDIRNMTWKNNFDCVFHIFTSFGYFETEKENLAVFDLIYKSLRTGAFYIFDYLNSNYVRKKFIPLTQTNEHGIFIKQKRMIKNNRIKKDIIIRNKNDERHYFESVALISPKVIENYLIYLGFKVIKKFANYNQEAFDENSSERFIILLEKP